MKPYLGQLLKHVLRGFEEWNVTVEESTFNCFFCLWFSWGYFNKNSFFVILFADIFFLLASDWCRQVSLLVNYFLLLNLCLSLASSFRIYLMSAALVPGRQWTIADVLSCFPFSQNWVANNQSLFLPRRCFTNWEKALWNVNRLVVCQHRGFYLGLHCTHILIQPAWVPGCSGHSTLN